eukprot:349737-Pleurochrysis_carterae.AAC.5
MQNVAPLLLSSTFALFLSRFCPLFCATQALVPDEGELRRLQLSDDAAASLNAAQVNAASACARFESVRSRGGLGW